MSGELKFYTSIFWRRFPYFIVIATLIGAVGVSIASVLPATYRAEALLVLENEQIPSDMAASTVRVPAVQELQIIQQRLLTRANLIDMANRFQIYQGERRLTPDDVVADMRRRTTIQSQVVGSTSSRVQDGALIVRVAFEADEPELSASIVNEFVGMIEQQNIDMRRSVASDTLRFFRDEVTRLSEEISIRNNRILEYRSENSEALPESLDFRRNRQAMLFERMRQIDREIASVEQRRDELVTLFETTGRLNNEATPLEQRYAEAREELAASLRVYAPQSPQIRAVQARVDQMADMVAQQSVSLRSEAEDEFQRLVGRIDSQISDLKDEKNLTSEEISQLQASIAATATVGLRLAEMEREVGAIRNQHQNAVNSLTQAQMGERIEFLAKGQRITVLEQAAIPSEAARPNRPLIAGAGIGLGFFLGLGFIALLELLNRSVRRPVEITNKLGISLIGVVPYIRTRRQIVVRRFLIGSALVFSLAVIPMGLWALHTYYLPIDLIIDRVSEKLNLSRML